MASSSVTLHPKTDGTGKTVHNPFPELIQTPSGLAILELQGTINLPLVDDNDASAARLQIGRISFPDYQQETHEQSDTSWMKRVHLYVGKHQRLTGEVKKLPKAMAVIRKRKAVIGEDIQMQDSTAEVLREDLEVVEIIKYKLVFAHRPEPVGNV